MNGGFRTDAKTVMEADTRRVRGERPYVFADMLRRQGLERIVGFVERAGGLTR